MLAPGFLAIFLLAIALGGVGAAIRQRNLHRWLSAYITGLFRSSTVIEPAHILLCVADHFEPAWNNVPIDVQRARMHRWMTGLPAFANRHRDSDGQPYRHTFFFPEEQYSPEFLEQLADLRRQGIGDVEIHLHHDGDTGARLREVLRGFARRLHDRHGLLRRHPRTGEITYGFVHGNWALDNARRDGKYCGVNDELTILEETGCYADFTLPAAPDDSQTRTINAIYRAIDDPAAPRSHDVGRLVEVGQSESDGLLIVQGPLTLNWRNRSRGILPRIENGELTGDNPPTPERADLWVSQRVHVRGRPDWVFVKLHTHGAQEADTEAILGGAFDETLTYMERVYNDGRRYVLHYVTAWEMYNVIMAAAAGKTGNPGDYRSWLDRQATA